MLSEDAVLFRRFVVAVFQTQSALLKHADVMNAPFGQTSATWRVMIYISQGHTTVADIARSADYSRQAVQRLADGLVAAGHACYHKHPTDARKQLIELTPDGEATLQSLEDHYNEWVERLFGSLSTIDIVGLTQRLSHVEHVVEEDSRQFQQKRQSKDRITKTRKGK